MTTEELIYKQTPITFKDEYIFDGVSGIGKRLKRFSDFFIALFCIIIFSPLFLYTYLYQIRASVTSYAILYTWLYRRYGKDVTQT